MLLEVRLGWTIPAYRRAGPLVSAFYQTGTYCDFGVL